MSVSKEARRTNRRLPQVVALLCPLVPGLAALNGVMQSPQFESYRTLDVIRLTASGACFGVSMVGLMMLLLRKRIRDHLLKEAIQETEEDNKS